MTLIALQEDEFMLVGFVVVEPSGTNDGVRTSACAYQPFSPPLPVVRLGGAVIGAGPVRDSDRSHQRDARFPRTERCEDVPNAAVIDCLRTDSPRRHLTRE